MAQKCHRNCLLLIWLIIIVIDDILNLNQFISIFVNCDPFRGLSFSGWHRLRSQTALVTECTANNKYMKIVLVNICCDVNSIKWMANFCLVSPSTATIAVCLLCCYFHVFRHGIQLMESPNTNTDLLTSDKNIWNESNSKKWPSLFLCDN